MNEPKTAFRVVLLVAAAGLLAIAAHVLRDKKLAVETITQQIEDTISALDPVTRAAVITRLSTDVGEKVKGRINR